jgi:RecB family endonuclease NucS
MNKKLAMFRRNEILRDVKHPSKAGSYSNTIKIRTTNSPKHELQKCRTAIELINAGCEVFTEVEFNNGIVCDILSIDKNGDAEIFEIMNTEKKKSIEAKRKKYPYPIHEVYTI